MITRILLIATLLFGTIGFGASAQKNNGAKAAERAEWFRQMGKYKTDFIADELKLTDEQKQKFVPIYEKMQNESSRLARDARKMEREVRKKGEAATDLELEKAAEAQVELKARQGELEKKYFTQLKSILTPRQLFNLNAAERKFTKQLMDSHKKSRRGRN